MPSWNENDYISRARELAQQHVVSQRPINELAEKVARDASLAPEEIRTLVRLTNVETFQEVFRRKEAGDKMVEFETGDAEDVIRRIQQVVKEGPRSASIDNDKLASFEVPDTMWQHRLGGGAPAVPDVATVKTASDAEPPLPSRETTLRVLAKYAKDMHIERAVQEVRWQRALERVASPFRKVGGYAPDFGEFEKDAIAMYGEDVLPEFVWLRHSLRMEPEGLWGQKVSSVQGYRTAMKTPLLEKLGEALARRRDFERFEAALGWMERNGVKK